ncbi:flavin reductase (NADPH)-like [Styela clava]
MSDVKRIIVFGATGQTGLKILKIALEEGLEVTAFVRTPSKIPENIRNRLYKVVKGEVKDKEIIEDAIQGHDAVLSALGGKLKIGTSDKIMSTGVANIIGGMKKHNVRNLIVVSGGLQLPSHAIPKFFLSFFVGELADHSAVIKLLENASDDIDWTAVAPPFIKDSDEIEPDYMVAINAMPGVSNVTSAEIADFMIKIITDKNKQETYKHAKVGISSRASTSFKAPIAILLLALAAGSIMYYTQ